MLTADDFFEAIHIARRRANMSIRELERLTGHSTNGLSPAHRRYMARSTGKRPGLILSTVAKVLAATNTTPEQWARDVAEARRFNLLREAVERRMAV